MRLLVVGAGWAGLSAAVRAVERGWTVTVLEAARQPGGRARSLRSPSNRCVAGDEPKADLDNGQHILIGAYRQTLALMRTLGLDPDALLLRLPLTLLKPDGTGLSLPPIAPPWNLLLGVLRAPGWDWRDRWSLLRTASRWQRQQFRCDPTWPVDRCCQGLTSKVMETLIEPLCVSALNTPVHRASAAVFLRVMQDALWSGQGGSDLLLPRTELGDLMPQAAVSWLQDQGARVVMGQRWAGPDTSTFQSHDAVLLACPAWEAARLAHSVNADWATQASSLQHEAIATVYAQHPDPDFQGLDHALMALTSNAQCPAQFVLDRGQVLGPAAKGVLAFVVSASQGSREDIEQAVLRQAQQQLQMPELRLIQTVVEKRATFACTPALSRPSRRIADGWWACGDYVQGPYPATLEGAVLSGVEVIDQIAQVAEGQGRR